MIGAKVISLLALVGTVLGNLDDSACYNDQLCAAFDSRIVDAKTKCKAEWGAFPRVNNDTNKLITKHLEASMEYLLIAGNFNNWKVQRPGFASYFTKLSDDKWNEAMGLLVYLMERGGGLNADFEVPVAPASASRMEEINTLSRALDIEKNLANRALHLAHDAIHVGQNLDGNKKHDPEFANFLAEKLHKNSVLRIKHLANYFNLLGDLLKDSADTDYALFKFDTDYLK